MRLPLLAALCLTLHPDTHAQVADTLYEAMQVPDFAQRNQDLLQRQFSPYGVRNQYGHYGYPLADRTRNVLGTVWVSLIIGANGRPRDLRPLTRLGTSCTDTALAVARRMAWQAGQLGGRPVAVRYTLAVPFPPPDWRATGHPTQAEIEIGNKFITKLTAPYAKPGITEPRFPAGVPSTHVDAYFTSTMRAAGGRYASASGLPVVDFVVEATGRVTHPKIVASVCPPCDSSVLAAVRRMPAWTPAKQQGRPVARPVRVFINYQAVANRPMQYLLPPPTIPAADTAEVLPTYPGGDAALRALVRRTYPVRTDPGANSLVLAVAGVVLPDGRFTDLQLAPLLAGLFRPQLSAVVAAMRPWQPGRTRGQPVAVRTVLLLPMPSSAAELRQLAAEEKSAQSAAKATPPDSKVYDVVEQMPRLPGNQTVNSAIRNAMKLPARSATGKVLVRFVVMPNGTIQQLQLLQSPSPALGQAVLAAVRQLPVFVPGRQNGRAVAVRYTVPVLVP